MTNSLLLIDIIFFGFFWFLIRLITNHKNVLAKPEAERQKLKKQLYWGMVLVLIVGVGSQLLMTSKTIVWPSWFWIVFTGYLLLWGIGGYFIWKAYRLGIKKDFKYATGPWQGKLKNPAKHVKHMATIELLTGISFLVFAVAIPLFKIEFRAWAPVILIIGSTRMLQYLKIARENET